MKLKIAALLLAVSHAATTKYQSAIYAQGALNQQKKTNVPSKAEIEGKCVLFNNPFVVFMKCECDLTLNGCDE
jgi:hypothetical protein